MKTLLLACGVLLVAHECVAPPPRHIEKKEEHESKEKEAQEPGGLEGLGIEYERYLREVIDVLESDQEFKKKLEAAEETDIRSGKIAHELEYVDHNIRSKLDEVKRAELERLRHYAQKEFELSNGIDVDHMKIQPPEHLDHDNPHTFEINDLKKLIHKVTNDLSEADKKRREEFKEYEMQKEFEKEEALKHMEGTEKEAFEKQLKDNETKHKQHDPLHHPGSKAQLEEVWEKQDHMKDQEFNPKVFFQLHDLDGNGYWDQNEVKVLFIKELDKLYQSGAPEDDMRERAEELERMREHVFKEADKNGDQLISFDEFLSQTKQPEFEKDEQWETIDQQQPVYTHDEYLEFERRRQQEIQHMIQQGLIPPQAQYHLPPGYHHQQQQQQFHQAGQHAQPQYHPQQFQQGHPQQLQQGHQQPPVYQPHQGQIPQHLPNPHQFDPNVHPPQYDPNAIHPGQVHPNVASQQAQLHHNALQQGQMYPNAQQGQLHPNAVPQQGQLHPNAVLQQGQLHPNAAPQQGQLHPNAVPQQGQLHPNAAPQQGQLHPNAVPQPGQGYPNIQQGQNHPNVQQGQNHPNAVPQQGQNYQPNQPAHPKEINQQGFQNYPNQAQQQPIAQGGNAPHPQVGIGAQQAQGSVQQHQGGNAQPQGVNKNEQVNAANLQNSHPNSIGGTQQKV